MGGRATVERHGREHMRKIGRAGAERTWSKYRLEPFGTSYFAMVLRETGDIVRVRQS